MSYPMTTMITMTTSLTGKIGTKKKICLKCVKSQTANMCSHNNKICAMKHCY